MDNLTLTILVSVIGSLISILLLIIGFFLTRLINQVDTTTKSVDNLSIVIGSLKEVFNGFEEKADLRHDGVLDRLKEHHSEIELARSRIHELFNSISGIKLQISNLEKKRATS